MPKTLARPEQTNLFESIRAIARSALRDVVAASTEREAMDLAAAALVVIADLARVEARHA